MADIKCPECGKENDELAGECRFCGAVLNPSPDEPRDQSSPESVEDFLASLRQPESTNIEPFQTDAEPAPVSPLIDAEQTISDFISRLRDFSIEQEVEMGVSSEAAEESLPDWIKELDSWQPAAPAAQTAEFILETPGENILSLNGNIPPQWLEAAEEKSAAVEPAQTGEEPAPPDADSEILAGWLSAQKDDQSRADEQISLDADIPVAEPLIDLPPAFEELSAAEAVRPLEMPLNAEEPPVISDVFETPAPALEEVREFSSLESLQEAELSPAEETAPGLEVETPAEIETLPAEAETGMEAAEPVFEAVHPDEIEAAVEAAGISAVQAAPVLETEPSEITETLSQETEAYSEAETLLYEAAEPAEAQSTLEQVEISAPEENPVDQVEAVEEVITPLAEPLAAEETETAALEAEIPDRIVAEEPGPAPAMEETENKPQVIILGETSPERFDQPAVETAETAAVLTQQTAPQYPGDETVFAPDENEAFGELLSQLRAEKTEFAAEEMNGIETAEQATPEWEAGEEMAGTEPVILENVSRAEYPGEEDIVPPAETENLDEWLGTLQAENLPQVFDTAQSEAVEEPSNAAPPFVSEDLDAWLKTRPQSLEGQEQLPDAETGQTPAAALPEWMNEITPAEPKNIPAGEENRQEPVVETGLPAWLASLQPMEENITVAVQPSADEAVEQSGPLAGIPGILPVFEASVFFRKPPLYSAQVTVSDEQRANAAKLTGMLEAEKQPVKKKRPERRTPHELLRTLVGILLIGVMLLPLFGLIPAAPGSWAGSIQAADAASFLSALDALPADASVLVAVEYSPGYADELGMAAAGTLKQLMEHNARIAMVTTNPSGLILAEDLKTRVLAANPNLQQQYGQRDWFINMGYLPGETLSLQELVSNPQQAAQYGIASGLENRLIWDSNVLKPIRSLADFSMLVLVSDTIETGRAWVEQVKPSIPDVPFLVVSSAQAAPMLQPYARSGQIQGLVTGLAGGYSLQGDDSPQTGSAENRWTSYQTGVIAVIVLILFGLLIEWIKTSRNRRRMNREVS